MKISSMKKIGLCAGLFLSGCSAPLTAETTEDYSKLNTLKYKIENYSMMEDKDIEQVTLWEKYLSYAVSFGIADKIVKRIQGLNLDDDLLNLVNQDSFLDFITSDYYLFYTYTSLDRKFVRAYRNTTGKVISSLR